LRSQFIERAAKDLVGQPIRDSDIFPRHFHILHGGALPGDGLQGALMLMQ